MKAAQGEEVGEEVKGERKQGWHQLGEKNIENGNVGRTEKKTVKCMHSGMGAVEQERGWEREKQKQDCVHM